MFNFQRVVYVTAEKFLNVQFRSIYKGSEIHFMVLALDQEGKEVYFNMRQDGDGQWKIINAPQVPDEIMKIEYNLSLIINGYQKVLNDNKLVA